MTSLALLLLLCQDPSPPVPVDAVAVITDINGGPVPDRIDTGSILVLSAKRSVKGSGTKATKWITTPPVKEVQRLFDADGDPVFILVAGAFPKTVTVELIVAKADTVDSQIVTVVIGDGTDPRPPPPEPKPQPDPKPEPQPVPAEQTFKITAIYNPMAVTPAQSSVLNNFDWRADYKRRGHSFVIATAGTQDQQCKDAILAATAKGISIPFLLFTDQSGKLVDVIPWTDTDAVDAAVKRLGGR